MAKAKAILYGGKDSAEKKLTKCQVFREVGSVANARHRHSKLTIEYLKVVTGLWRSGSAEDS